MWSLCKDKGSEKVSVGCSNGTDEGVEGSTPLTEPDKHNIEQ